MRSGSLVARAIAALLITTGVARAEDVYKDRTINIVVGLSPGGGYDLYARTLSRHLGRHVPGAPKIIVNNMPGAGSLASLLWLENVAPRDGTVIAAFNLGMIGDSVLSPEKVKLDFRRFAWLGSIAEDLSACYMWHTKGPKTLAEVRAAPVIHFGQTGPGSSSDIAQRILKNVLGVKLEEVNGYPGSSDLRLAVERGELDGDCGAWAVIPPEWLAQKKIFPFIKNSPAFGRDMPKDVPYVADMAPTPRDRRIIEMLVSSTQVGRPYVMHRDVPADRLRIMREAFDATLRDPEFLADLDRQSLPLSPKTAQESLDIVGAIAATPADIVAAARKVMRE